MAEVATSWRPAAGIEFGDPAPPIALPDERGAIVALHADALGGDAVMVAFCLAAARPTATLGEHPPVLVLPRLLNPPECEALIEVWHRPVRRWHSDALRTEGFANEEGEFKIRIDTYGKTDQFVIRDPAVLEHVDSRLVRRVGPQIRKAFGQSASYREDLHIACYDAAESGSLPVHRDNPTSITRYRVFTLSIHLNASDYEGGRLRFPEYGLHGYEVERGTGVVWSCSLLHEVEPVTRSRRFRSRRAGGPAVSGA